MQIHTFQANPSILPVAKFKMGLAECAERARSRLNGGGSKEWEIHSKGSKGEGGVFLGQCEAVSAMFSQKCDELVHFVVRVRHYF